MPDGRKYGPVIAKNQNCQNFILLSCFVQLSFEPPFKVWEYVKELWAACVPPERCHAERLNGNYATMTPASLLSKSPDHLR